MDNSGIFPLLLILLLLFSCGENTEIQHSNHVEMHSVSSSAIDAVGYNESTQELVIRFAGNSKEYSYPDVPLEVYEGLLSAPSKGRYFNQYIRDQYSSRRR